nr:trypsin-like peptidase domain-containing protein [Streptomyces abyssomicinicus]
MAPSGLAPSGPAPSGPAPSGPAPSGPAPSGPAPSGPAPSGPAPSGAAASGLAPDGPAPSGATPDGATPSGATPSGATSSGLAPGGAAPSGLAPDGATPSGPAPSGATPDGATATPDGATSSVPDAGAGPVPGSDGGHAPVASDAAPPGASGALDASGAPAPAAPDASRDAVTGSWEPPVAGASVPAGSDPGGRAAHGASGPVSAAPAVPTPDVAGGQQQPAAADALASGPAGPADPTGPWGRYDPWAAPGTGPAPVDALPLQGGGTAAESPARRRNRRRRALVGGAAAVALVAGLGGGVAGVYLERYGGLGVVELSQAPLGDTPRDPDSVAGIAERALPSVVTLHVQGSGQAGTGTGFVLDDRGHILTNHHVVQAAEDSGDGRIAVTFSGGETARAELVGGDAGYDLAVVRVKGVKGLNPMPLGNSDDVRVGDPVVAIGAPFDLANTVTAGIISAKERPITAGGEGDGSDVSYVDALQTDAPINPGNSGGPLLDARGRVIGINSAIRSADTGIGTEDGGSGSIGLGFAIPVNQAKRVAEELINEGEATHPVIGVTLDMAYPGDGARVHTQGVDGGSPVTPGGPGAEAGLKPGDVITAVDGIRVHSGDELIVKTRARRPGDRLELTVERDGEEREVTLVLGSSGG